MLFLLDFNFEKDIFKCKNISLTKICTFLTSDKYNCSKVV